SGPASKPPSLVALSAAGFPSLQIRIFIAELQFVSGNQGVNDNGCANQRQRHEGQANFRPSEILRRNRADLRANGRARVHDERDQNINVAFDGMSKRSVTGRDNDLEQVGADREMGWNSQNVNHRRHPDVTGAAAEKAAKQSADERDEDNYPKRNRYARSGKSDHWPKLPTLNASGNMVEGGRIVFLLRACRRRGGSCFF